LTLYTALLAHAVWEAWAAPPAFGNAGFSRIAILLRMYHFLFAAVPIFCNICWGFGSPSVEFKHDLSTIYGNFESFNF
jgi:hypothetical protein